MEECLQSAAISHIFWSQATLFTCSQPFLARWVCLGSPEPMAHLGWPHLLGGAHWLCPWWLQLKCGSCEPELDWLKTCLLNVPNKQKCQICLCVWRYFPNRPHGALLVLATKKSGWSCRPGLSQHSCKWCVWLGQLHTTVTGGKGSDEYNPMPSNPAGWFFKYGLSLYISEGYVRYSKYSTLWLYWGILREEQKLSALTMLQWLKWNTDPLTSCEG